MLILIILQVFHLEISGKDNKEIHPQKISPILIILKVFHFEISGKDDNDSQPQNTLPY